MDKLQFHRLVEEFNHNASTVGLSSISHKPCIRYIHSCVCVYKASCKRDVHCISISLHVYVSLHIVSSVITSHVYTTSLSSYPNLSASSFFPLSFFHPSCLFETCLQKWSDSCLDFKIHNTHTLTHRLTYVCCVVSVIGGHPCGKLPKSTCFYFWL